MQTLYFLCAAHDDAASRSHSPTPSASVPSFTSSTHEPMITLTGQRAAKVLAAALRSPVHNKMRVDCIVSSPSSRALDTLHLAMPWLSKLPVIALEGLRSRRSSPINDIRRSVCLPSCLFCFLASLYDHQSFLYAEFYLYIDLSLACIYIFIISCCNTYIYNMVIHVSPSFIGPGS